MARTPEDLNSAMDSAHPNQALVSSGDIVRLARLLTGGLLARLTPRNLDQVAADALLRLGAGNWRGSTAELAALMAQSLGPNKKADWQRLAEENVQMASELAWATLRGVSSERWYPNIEFVGESKVRTALKAGRGAVFWCMHFSSAEAVKQGFHQIGLPLVHLGSALHGTAGSSTRFATSVISPLVCRGENRWLADRLVIPSSGSVSHLRKLRGYLQENHCVSIISDTIGRQQVELPFLIGRRKFSTGAPSLAWSENSALFSVHVIRTGPFQYRVIVGESIPVDRSLTRKEFVSAAVLEFGRRMEDLVERHPSDWQEWQIFKSFNKY